MASWERNHTYSGSLRAQDPPASSGPTSRFENSGLRRRLPAATLAHDAGYVISFENVMAGFTQCWREMRNPILLSPAKAHGQHERARSSNRD